MDSSQQVRGQICGIENCRSRRYHVAEDGYTYCSNGHRAELAVLTQDEYEGINIGQTTRKNTDTGPLGSAVFHGRQALELYLQCFQLVLWKQVHWLVNVRGYPKTLEAVVRDIWALRIQLFDRVLTETQSDGEAAQFFSSQVESEEDSRPRSRNGDTQARRQVPKLIESVSLCYLGIIILRLPIMSRDVREWVSSHDFPYLRAVMEIPKQMRRRLPSVMLQTFNPALGIRDLEKIHIATMNLAGSLASKYSLEFPKLNFPLLLHRFVNELCLPLSIFPSTLHLVSLLSLPLNFSTSTRSRNPISSHPEISLVTTLIITTKLLYPFDSTVRNPRLASEPAALKVNWQVWNDLYAQARAEAAAKPAPAKSSKDVGKKGPADMTEHDVWGMEGADIDEYLEWFGKTWVEEEDPDAEPASQRATDMDFRRALYNMFPVTQARSSDSAPPSMAEDSAPDSPHVQRLKAVQASLRPVNVVPRSASERENEILRPGSQYKHYRSVDEVPEIARPFFEAVANLVGLSMEDMVLAVFQMEMKVQKWVRRERKVRKGEKLASEETIDENDDD